MPNLIYILRNDSHPENVYKIGRTDRIIHERINELSAGCLIKYKEIITWSVNNNTIIESKIHNALDLYRIKNLHVREFFDIPLEKAKTIINNILIAEEIEINNPKIINEQMILEKYPIIKDIDDKLYIYVDNHWQYCSSKEKLIYQISCKDYINTFYIKSIVNGIFLELKPKNISWNLSLQENELSFKDYILNIDTNEIKNHSPNNYINKLIRYNYIENSSCDLWINTLLEWFKDPSKILFLQEFFGFILSFNYDWRKILILQGPFNCGKYTIIKILRKIVGNNNAFPIFQKFLLNSKYLEIIENSILTNVHAIIPEELTIKENHFNTLINQKYSKFIFNIESDNKQYDCKINNKIQTIIFDNITINENYQKNTKLFEKLQLEIEGIVKWSVDGFKRLLKNNGEFTKID